MARPRSVMSSCVVFVNTLNLMTFDFLLLLLFLAEPFPGLASAALIQSGYVATRPPPRPACPPPLPPPHFGSARPPVQPSGLVPPGEHQRPVREIQRQNRVESSPVIPRQPTRAELYRQRPQSLLRTYTSEGTFHNAAFILVKNDYLAPAELRAVSQVSKAHHRLVTSVPKLKRVDFTPLREPRLDYASQKAIDPARVVMMDALAVHYDLDLGLVMRWLGGEYTAAWRLPALNELIDDLQGLLSEEDIAHVHRIITGDVPAELNYHESAKNKFHHINSKRHPSLDVYPEVMTKALNKEERNSHIMPFSSWIVQMSQVCHHVPQMVIYKNGKGRVIWNGTSKSWAWVETMNEVSATLEEADVTFGDTLPRFFKYIYNMRISYPDEDIALGYLDISSCFRFPRIFPDLIGAFGFVHDDLFFASNAHVFGHSTSASSWDPLRRAIEVLAKQYFHDDSLVHKYADLLDEIQFNQESTQGVQFARARSCPLNQGVFDEHGHQLPTPHHFYVDDNLIAATWRYIRRVLAAAMEATFRVCGAADERFRPSALNRDKLRALVVAYRAILLGFQFDTRLMTVGITSDFRAELVTLLTQTWHAGRQSFSVPELETLVGKLGRVGQIFPPIYHVLGQLYASLGYALRQNGRWLYGSNKEYRQLMKEIRRERGESVSSVEQRRVNFAVSVAAKRQHGCDRRYRMPPSFQQELGFLRDIITDDTVELSSHLGALVPRTPEWDAAGDACKSSGGGWSTSLRFWWYWHFPSDVEARARLPSATSKGFICINCLETVVIIINLAAAIVVCATDGLDTSYIPILLNYCDNTSACSWVTKRCRGGLIGRALGRLFMGLLLSTDIGIQAEWLSTTDNKLADLISRFTGQNIDYDFSRLIVDYPQLKVCRRFVPSASLLKLLHSTLLGRCSPDPMALRKLKPIDLGVLIG